MVQTIKAICDVVKVNDDNELAPENILEPTDEPRGTIFNNEWGHSGFCHRKTANMTATRPNQISPLIQHEMTSTPAFSRIFPHGFLGNHDCKNE